MRKNSLYIQFLSSERFRRVCMNFMIRKKDNKDILGGRSTSLFRGWAGEDVPGGLDLSQDLSPISTVTLDYKSFT